jgi:hypothetical protein
MVDLLAADRTDIPGIRLLGIVIGVLLVIAALRWMFGKR